MMFKKISFLFLALITVMINSHASLQHDMEHHYHHEHDSHEDHKNHADLEVEYNTENCEQCLLEHSIAESNHLQDSVKFIFPNENIFYSALFAIFISSRIFLVYQSRAP